MRNEIIQRFSVSISGMKYRDAARKTDIPQATICNAMKKRTASDITIIKMVHYIEKDSARTRQK